MILRRAEEPIAARRTQRWSRPLARIRSPRLLTATLNGHTSAMPPWIRTNEQEEAVAALEAFARFLPALNGRRGCQVPSCRSAGGGIYV
jgi:hypothetical protein